MLRTESYSRGRPACLTLPMPASMTSQKTGSKGRSSYFSVLPSRVDSTPLVDPPKISVEIFSHSSVLKDKVHTGHTF